MLVHVFDRVLDRDDMVGSVFVAIAHHRRQRGRFTGTRAADEDHQAALDHRDVAQDRRQVEVLHLRNPGVDGPHHDADAPLLHEDVDAETADLGRADGEVGFVGGLEILPLLLVHDGARQFAGVRGGQALVRHRGDLAVDLDGGRKAGSDEEVGCILRQHQAQQVVDGFFGVHRSALNPKMRLCSAPRCAPRRRK